jgi:hypothetical protein
MNDSKKKGKKSVIRRGDAQQTSLDQFVGVQHLSKIRLFRSLTIQIRKTKQLRHTANILTSSLLCSI